MPTSKRHYRITLGDAIAAHETAISEHGGRDGIHDVGLIESAVARPYSGYYRPIYKKGAALIQSVATNHGFIDGNKRTALILFYLLLNRSGYSLRQSSTSEDSDDVEHLIMDVTTKFLRLEEVMLWLRNRIYRRR